MIVYWISCQIALAPHFCCGQSPLLSRCLLSVWQRFLQLDFVLGRDIKIETQILNTRITPISIAPRPGPDPTSAPPKLKLRHTRRVYLLYGSNGCGMWCACDPSTRGPHDPIAHQYTHQPPLPRTPLPTPRDLCGPPFTGPTCSARRRSAWPDQSWARRSRRTGRSAGRKRGRRRPRA